jgi:hypothetical protein
MGAKWTEDEDSRLTALWASNRTAKSAVPEFPGRTFEALLKRAAHLGLDPKSQSEAPTVQKIRECLKDGKARTAAEISDETGTDAHRIRICAYLMVDACEIHVESYDGPYRAAIFVYGPGENATKPEPLTEKERRLRHFAKVELEVDDEEVERAKDEEHRDRNCAWWPKADLVVVNAFRAMVANGMREAA